MTAGAALVLDRHADTDDDCLSKCFETLTARDYDEGLQGAMFLTEKQGGNDVGANETVAERADGNRLPLDAFDAIVRYASVPPGAVEALSG